MWNRLTWGTLASGDNYCGNDYTDEVAAQNASWHTKTCCRQQMTIAFTEDCDSASAPTGPAFDHVVDFAASEDEWLEAYVAAWKMAQENGWSSLSALSS